MPGEIESIIVSEEGIEACRVFSFKDRLYGENLGACVTLKAGTVFQEDIIREHVKQAVGSFKVPAFFFVFDAFPLNATGKIDQRSLHMQMLCRIHALELEGALEKGVLINTVTAKNTSIGIDPLSSMIEAYALRLGFSARKAGRIRLAAEEMLTERIINAFEDVGDIHIRLECFKDFLRITFADSGQPYNFEKQRKVSDSAKIIAFAADDLSDVKGDDGMNHFHLDFLFEGSFDIARFLAAHERLS